MRITLKLSLAIGLSILVVLGLHATFRVRADLELARSEIRRNHVLLGRVLATGVALLLERDDPERAQELVSAVNARESGVQIRWLRPGAVSASRLVDGAAPPTALGAAESHLAEPGGASAIVTYVGVGPVGAGSVIEVAQDLSGEAEHVREVVTRTTLVSLALLAACLGALLAFGHLLVGRPIARLRDHARRVGRGDLRARLPAGSRDELGDLSREMDSMTARLEEARELAARETAARAQTLERLRHADRLRAVGEMASAVAHEIGTPLAIARARAQQLEGGAVKPERVGELAAIVIAEIDRVSKIIQRLLAVSRRDAREVEEVAPARWAEETIALLEPLARAAGVELSLDVEHAHGRVSFEAGTLRHVLINLVMNAVHASAPGARVWVRLEVEASERLRIVVEDSGPGVPDVLRDEIFEPFFTTKVAAEGTGLGLPVAAGIVREQGGALTVGDREGGGARFVVDIPVGRDRSSARTSTRRGIAPA